MNPSRMIGLIVLLAASLRVWGIAYGLPHLYHQDEPMMVNRALAIGMTGWNTHYFVIPPFVTYLLFFVYGIYFVAGSALGFFAGKEAFAAAFLNDPTVFYVLGRLVTGALFGTAAVWMTARVTRRFFSESAAVWAALFMAVVPINVQHSHFIYADPILAFAVLLLLDRLLSIPAKPSLRRYALAGAVLGWGCAVKYPMIVCVPAALAVHVWAWRGRVLSAKALTALAAAILVSAAVFFAVAPFTLLDWAGFMADVQTQRTANLHAVYFAHHAVYSLVFGTGLPFLALSAAGFVLASVRRDSRAAAATIGLMAVSFYGFIAFFGQYFPRYALPLVPLLAVPAGAAAAVFFSCVRSSWPRAILAEVLTASLAVPSAYGDWLMTREDTRTQCARWFAENVKAGESVAVDSRFWGPPLRQSEPVLREKLNAVRADDPMGPAKKKRVELELSRQNGVPSYAVYLLAAQGDADVLDFLFLKPTVRMSAEALTQAGVRYIVLNRSEHKDEIEAFRLAAGERLVPVAKFSPYRDGSLRRPNDSLTPADYPWLAGKIRQHKLERLAATSVPFMPREIFARDRMGPCLEVYEWRS